MSNKDKLLYTEISSKVFDGHAGLINPCYLTVAYGTIMAWALEGKGAESEKIVFK